MIATPAEGYAFAGWSGYCSQLIPQAAVFFRVNGPKQCEALFEPWTGPSKITTLYVESQIGDFIGQGLTRTYAVTDATFSAQTDGTSVTIDVSAPFFGRSLWSLTLSAPTGTALAPGTYLSAARSASPTQAGLNVSADNRGCSTVTGRFLIREFIAGSD